MDSGYSKTCVKRPLSKRPKIVFKTNYRLMQIKSIAMFQGEHSAILSTFIKLLFVIKISVMSIFERPFRTGFTVYIKVSEYEQEMPHSHTEDQQRTNQWHREEETQKTNKLTATWMQEDN